MVGVIRFCFLRTSRNTGGPGSSVAIVTGYGLDGPGSNPGGGKIFRTCPKRPRGHTQPPVQWVPGLSWEVKSGLGVTLTTHHFYCRGQERVELYLYSPYGPFGMYRTSMPVQGRTFPFFLVILHCHLRK